MGMRRVIHSDFLLTELPDKGKKEECRRQKTQFLNHWPQEFLNRSQARPFERKQSLLDGILFYFGTKFYIRSYVQKLNFI